MVRISNGRAAGAFYRDVSSGNRYHDYKRNHKQQEVVAVASLKVELPMRRAMLSIYEPPEYYPWQDVTVTRHCKQKEVARVPVFVWPIPTVDGYFIVEHQDGHCQKVQPYELTFLGSRELFDQYDWSEA